MPGRRNRRYVPWDAVLLRAAGRCQTCHEVVTPTGWAVGWQVAISEGGHRSMPNAAVFCLDCAAKRSPEERLTWPLWAKNARPVRIDDVAVTTDPE